MREIASGDNPMSEGDTIAGVADAFASAREARAEPDLFDALPWPAHLCAQSGLVVRSNERALAFWRSIDPDARSVALPAAWEIGDAIAEERTIVEREVSLTGADGAQRTVLLSLQPLGRARGALCLLQDITARARIEEEWRTREHRYLQILDAVPAAIYTTDADGYVTYCNPAGLSLAGRPVALGEDQWCITWRLYDQGGQPLPRDRCPMAIALKERRPVRNVEVIAEHPDGSRMPVMPHPTPIYDSDGVFAGGVNLLVDIAELTRAKAELSASAREQSALFQFTDRLQRADTLEEIYDAALDAICEALGCPRASVLLFNPAGEMRFVAWRGLSEGYRAAVDGHTPWTPRDVDAEPITVEDMERSNEPAWLKRTVAAEGIRSLAFVPLITGGRVIGKFMLYRDEPHDFSKEELDLALAIARQLCFGIERRRADAALAQSEARFRLMADAAPVLIWMSGPDKRATWFNRPWLEFTGRTMEQELGRGWTANVHREDAERCWNVYSEAFDARKPFTSEYRLLRWDGQHRWILDNGVPLYTADGQFAGYIGSCVDITPRKSAEETLKKSEEEFHTLADNIHQFAWMTDASGWIYWYNQRWFDYTGATPEEMRGWGWTKVHHPDHVDRVAEKFRACIERGEPWEDVFPLRRHDGEYGWFLSRALPIRDETGEVVRWFGTNTDITEARKAEEQRTLLINELNHRVKNTLATVQSLASQTFRNTERSEDARELFEARLAALSRAHDVLNLESWEGAYLKDIVARALEAFQFESERLQVRGPEVRLSPKQAVALSMALHELATNAVKYGALSGGAGVVAIDWTVQLVEGRPELKITWTEHGGPEVTPPSRAGFGSRLIQRSLAHDLGAPTELRFEPRGVVAELRTLIEPAAPRPGHIGGYGVE